MATRKSGRLLLRVRVPYCPPSSCKKKAVSMGDALTRERGTSPKHSTKILCGNGAKGNTSHFQCEIEISKFSYRSNLGVKP